MVCYEIIRFKLPEKAVPSIEKKINAAAIADPTAISAAMALASLSLPDGEHLLNVLLEQLPRARLIGLDDEETAQMARERIKATIDQAIGFRRILAGSRKTASTTQY